MTNKLSKNKDMFLQSFTLSNNRKILVTSGEYEEHLNRYMNYNSSNAFIVDQNGIIRGIYNIQSRLNAKRLIEDLKKLI